MAGTDPVWEVRLFQLNVSRDGAGDCAIILLLNTNVLSPAKPKVASAVLVDGGEGPKITDILTTTMQQLKDEVAFDSDDGDFKFDAISISHWDTVSAA